MCDQGLQSKSIKLKKLERVGELHFFDIVVKLVHLHLLLWLQSSVKVFLKELLSVKCTADRKAAYSDVGSKCGYSVCNCSSAASCAKMCEPDS